MIILLTRSSYESRKLVDSFSKKFQLQALCLTRIQLSTKLLALMFAAVTCLSCKQVKHFPRCGHKHTEHEKSAMCHFSSKSPFISVVTNNWGKILVSALNSKDIHFKSPTLLHIRKQN